MHATPHAWTQARVRGAVQRVQGFASLCRLYVKGLGVALWCVTQG